MSHFIYTEIYKKNAMAQNLGPHFAPASASEMHLKISQETLYTEFTRKCRTPEPKTTLCANLRSRNALPFHKNIQEKCRAPSQPRTQTLTLCQRAQSKCMSTLHKDHFILKLAGKMSQTRTLCEPAKSKCMSTFLQFHKSHFLQKFTGKMPRPKNLGLLGPHFARACVIEMHFKVS